MGPIGPRGFNGSQGPPGPMGSIGLAGPKGTGEINTCQYKTLKAEETPGAKSIIVWLNEPAVTMRCSKSNCAFTVHVSQTAYLRASNGLSHWATKYTHTEQANCKCASTLNRLVFCRYAFCNDFLGWFSPPKKEKNQQQQTDKCVIKTVDLESKHDAVLFFPSPMKWEGRGNLVFVLKKIKTKGNRTPLLVVLISSDWEISRAIIGQRGSLRALAGIS